MKFREKEDWMIVYLALLKSLIQLWNTSFRFLFLIYFFDYYNNDKVDTTRL